VEGYVKMSKKNDCGTTAAPVYALFDGTNRAAEAAVAR